LLCVFTLLSLCPAADTLFKHARCDTPSGAIPSKNIEVNGELLQILPRLYGATGEQKYLDWAHRLADFYLLPGGFVPSSLKDHGWGYDFVAFLDYDLALGTQRYHAAIRRPMTNLLKPRYRKFNWDHGSRDNVADSVEGGLYLLSRIPTPEAFLWADREIATLLVDHADPARLWGVDKLEANTVRTVLIHTMLHTRNTLARPWRQGLQLGAAPCGDGICVFMKSDVPYAGRLQFDIPRHRLFMGFTQDWPRMNAMPEWFTVEPDRTHQYEVEDVDDGKKQLVTGRFLSKGLPVQLQPGSPLRLVVRPAN
jgi:hypothetical protein